MMNVLSISERETKERKRQIEAIREYNRLKKVVFENRLDKFLNLYPYNTNYCDCMDRFIKVVNDADETMLNKLIIAFNEENKYWSTYYALHNCNDSIYQHILSVLTLMHDSLLEKISNISSGEVQNQVENTISEWGAQGEKEVDYVLKWLTDDYYVIDKDCTSKYSDRCILLENQMFIDECQEFDHIVVGPQGVFLIETKNYSGKLHIDNQGNWLRMKKNEYEWTPETNPSQQVVRHHVLMESILGSDIPIIDVICLSHPDIITSGLENAQIPVIKKDQLGDFIMRYKGEFIDEDIIDEVVCKINMHKISK